MNKHLMSAVILAASLSGCAGVEKKRDSENEARIDSYIQSLGSANTFDPQIDCNNSPSRDDWWRYEFSTSTKMSMLPNGVPSVFVCVKIPDGSTELRLDSDPTGGLSYFGMTILHPSAQFLDQSYGLIKDYPVPRMRVGQGLLNNFGLTGTFDLTKVLATSEYIVVYVHPGSLESGIDVNNGMMNMWVPYSPHGALRFKFK